MINLILPQNGEIISILSDECKLFYQSEEIRNNNNDEDNSLDWRNPKILSEDCSKPLPVKLIWSDDDDNSVSGVYVVAVSENEDLSDPIVRISEEKCIDFYNLCVGTKYYWCVQKGCYRSDIRSFTVSDDSPRLLYIDGIGNVRDMGGYNVPGGRIRQKMMYRGCELDNNLKITENGINELLRLGIKTDLDIRSDESRFKVQYSILTWYGAQHLVYPIGAYKYIDDCYHMKLYKEIMLKLTDENTYPFYMHCVAGADRTGTLAFLIGALLGMSYNDLMDEYELTSISRFGGRSRHGKGMQEILTTINKYNGNNINEKVENYMLDGLGLLSSDIEKIRTILIE